MSRSRSSSRSLSRGRRRRSDTPSLSRSTSRSRSTSPDHFTWVTLLSPFNQKSLFQDWLAYTTSETAKRMGLLAKIESKGKRTKEAWCKALAAAGFKAPRSKASVVSFLDSLQSSVPPPTSTPSSSLPTIHQVPTSWESCTDIELNIGAWMIHLDTSGLSREE